jgi:hypothetical protein
MRFPHLFEIVAGLALVAGLAAPAATAQTVISNETLMTTTFVVNKQVATARCGQSGCRSRAPIFAAIPVTCPAAIGQTCTFHISLDAKISLDNGWPTFYQFLVDGAAPTIGPTAADGTYIFQDNATTLKGLPLRQSFPASVVATVTNSSSNDHTITVYLGCIDSFRIGGCETTAHSRSMRVDVFEP